MGFNVKAKQLGFYGGVLRHEDEEFSIEKISEKGRWMAFLEPKDQEAWEAWKAEQEEAKSAEQAQKNAASVKTVEVEKVVEKVVYVLLDDLKAGELIAYAEANGLDIGGLVPQSGKDKILEAVKAARAKG